MKIAVYHNLGSGGNKRLLYETVRGMKAHGHTVHVYNLGGASEAFWPLHGVADEVITSVVPLVNVRGFLSTFNSQIHPADPLPVEGEPGDRGPHRRARL